MPALGLSAEKELERRHVSRLGKVENHGILALFRTRRDFRKGFVRESLTVFSEAKNDVGVGPIFTNYGGENGDEHEERDEHEEHGGVAREIRGKHKG